MINILSNWTPLQREMILFEIVALSKGRGTGDKESGGERSGFKNGRRYGTRGGKQIIRTEAVIIYVGRDRASPQPRNKNCSPGQSPGEKFTSFPTLCILPVAKLCRMESRRRDASPRAILEILLLSVSRQVQPDITADTRRTVLRLNLIEIFLFKFASSRDRVDHFHREMFLLKCIRNCFFFFFFKWEHGKFKTRISRKYRKISHIFENFPFHVFAVLILDRLTL